MAIFVTVGLGATGDAAPAPKTPGCKTVGKPTKVMADAEAMTEAVVDIDGRLMIVVVEGSFSGEKRVVAVPAAGGRPIELRLPRKDLRIKAWIGARNFLVGVGTTADENGVVIVRWNLGDADAPSVNQPWVSKVASGPRAAWNGRKLLVGWEEYDRAEHRSRYCVGTFDPMTGKSGEPVPLSPLVEGHSASGGRIAALGDTFAAIWEVGRKRGQPSADYRWGLLSEDGSVRGEATALPSLDFPELYGCDAQAIVTDTPLMKDSLQARFISPDGTASDARLLGPGFTAEKEPGILCMGSAAAVGWREVSAKTKEVAIHVTLLRVDASPADLIVTRKRMTGTADWGCFYHVVFGQTSNGGTRVAWTEGKKGRTAYSTVYDIYSQALSCPVVPH
jgi:hypothetical protein